MEKKIIYPLGNKCLCERVEKTPEKVTTSSGIIIDKKDVEYAFNTFKIMRSGEDVEDILSEGKIILVPINAERRVDENLYIIDSHHISAILGTE